MVARAVSHVMQTLCRTSRSSAFQSLAKSVTKHCSDKQSAHPQVLQKMIRMSNSET